MSDKHTVSKLLAQIESMKDKEALNSREDKHWYQKFMDLRDALIDAIERSNGADPAMNILAELVETPAVTLENKIANEMQMELACK